MKNYAKQTLVFATLASALMLASCMSYTTLQGPETLEPGHITVGGGMGAFQGGGLFFEVGGRVGIINNFDAGLKLSIPKVVFIDAKYRIIEAPLMASFDLGYSVNREKDNLDKIFKFEVLYPAIIIGGKEWYTGVKGLFSKASARTEFFNITLDASSGFHNTGGTFFVGGILGLSSFRLLGEVNFVFIKNASSAIIVPAAGIQITL